MIDTAPINTAEQMTNDLDETVQDTARSLVSKVSDIVNRYNEAYQQLMLNDDLTDDGKKRRAREAAAEAIQALEALKDNSITTAARNEEVMLRAKAEKLLESSPGDEARLREIRSYLREELGSDVFKWEARFIQACSEGKLDIARAIASHPMWGLRPPIKTQGLKALGQAKLDSPKLKALNRAAGVVNSVVMHGINELNKTYNVRPTASFEPIDLRGGRP